MDRLLAAGRETEFDAHRATCVDLRRARPEMEDVRRDARRRCGRPPRRARSARVALIDPVVDGVLRAAPKIFWRARSKTSSAARGRDASASATSPGARRAPRPPAFSRSGDLSRARAVAWLATRGSRRSPAKPRPPGARPEGGSSARAARSRSRTPRRSLVMVLGLNPADLARKAGTARLEQTRALRRRRSPATRPSTASAPSRRGPSGPSRP